MKFGREQCWFVKSLDSLPQGTDGFPLPQSVFATLHAVHAGTLTAGEYAQELALVMKKFETNTSLPIQISSV